MRPSSSPSGGISTPSTSVVTILPNAAPMITPTARSMTLPRAMKSRNSFSIPAAFPAPQPLFRFLVSRLRGDRAAATLEIGTRRHDDEVARRVERHRHRHVDGIAVEVHGCRHMERPAFPFRLGKLFDRVALKVQRVLAFRSVKLVDRGDLAHLGGTG